jgi:hypothetical protein
MARLIQIGSTFRPDDLLCGIGYFSGLLARSAHRTRSHAYWFVGAFFRAHGASRPARFQSEPGAPCVRELMRFGEARAPTRDRVLAARLPVPPDRGAHEPACSRLARGPGGSPYRLLGYRPSDDRATSRRRAGPRSRKARDTDGYTPRTRRSLVRAAGRLRPARRTVHTDSRSSTKNAPVTRQQTTERLPYFYL